MMMAKAPTNSTLHEYLTEAGELPEDVLLGRIVLFTVVDGRYKFSDIDQWFDDLHLNRAMMPAANKAVDAFRKATSALNGETYPLEGGAQEAYLLCRDVAINDNYVRRQITREIKDSKKRKLSYDEAITCTFYRAMRADRAGGTRRRGERLDVRVRQENLRVVEYPVAEKLANRIHRDFLAYYEYLDGNKVRGTVRKYLKHLNAIEIKGGVYFVHISKDDELQRLADFVTRLGGGCYMATLPIVDLKKEREFIADAFEREASQALQDLTKEAKDLLQTRKTITPEMYQKMKQKFDNVLANANEHMATLEVSQDLTAASAEVALEALGALREEMLK